jgi:hypothetical protein
MCAARTRRGSGRPPLPHPPPTRARPGLPQNCPRRPRHGPAARPAQPLFGQRGEGQRVTRCTPRARACGCGGPGALAATQREGYTPVSGIQAGAPPGGGRRRGAARPARRAGRAARPRAGADRSWGRGGPIQSGRGPRGEGHRAGAGRGRAPAPAPAATGGPPPRPGRGDSNGSLSSQGALSSVGLRAGAWRRHAACAGAPGRAMAPQGAPARVGARGAAGGGVYGNRCVMRVKEWARGSLLAGCGRSVRRAATGRARARARARAGGVRGSGSGMRAAAGHAGDALRRRRGARRSPTHGLCGGRRMARRGASAGSGGAFRWGSLRWRIQRRAGGSGMGGVPGAGGCRKDVHGADWVRGARRMRARGRAAAGGARRGRVKAGALARARDARLGGAWRLHAARGCAARGPRCSMAARKRWGARTWWGAQGGGGVPSASGRGRLQGDRKGAGVPTRLRGGHSHGACGRRLFRGAAPRAGASRVGGQMPAASPPRARPRGERGGQGDSGAAPARMGRRGPRARTEEWGRGTAAAGRRARRHWCGRSAVFGVGPTPRRAGQGFGGRDAAARGQAAPPVARARGGTAAPGAGRPPSLVVEGDQRHARRHELGPARARARRNAGRACAAAQRDDQPRRGGKRVVGARAGRRRRQA